MNDPFGLVVNKKRNKMNAWIVSNPNLGIKNKTNSYFGINNRPHSEFGIKRCDIGLTWNQAKKKYPGMKKFGDADLDGTLNYKDCKPFDPSQDGIMDVVRAIGSGVSKVAKATGRVASKVLYHTDKNYKGYIDRRKREAEHMERSAKMKAYAEAQRGLVQQHRKKQAEHMRGIEAHKRKIEEDIKKMSSVKDSKKQTEEYMKSRAMIKEYDLAQKELVKQNIKTEHEELHQMKKYRSEMKKERKQLDKTKDLAQKELVKRNIKTEHEELHQMKKYRSEMKKERKQLDKMKGLEGYEEKRKEKKEEIKNYLSAQSGLKEKIAARKSNYLENLEKYRHSKAQEKKEEIKKYLSAQSDLKEKITARKSNYLENLEKYRHSKAQEANKIALINEEKRRKVEYRGEIREKQIILSRMYKPLKVERGMALKDYQLKRDQLKSEREGYTSELQAKLSHERLMAAERKKYKLSTGKSSRTYQTPIGTYTPKRVNPKSRVARGKEGRPRGVFKHRDPFTGQPIHVWTYRKKMAEFKRMVTARAESQALKELQARTGQNVRQQISPQQYRPPVQQIPVQQYRPQTAIQPYRQVQRPPQQYQQVPQQYQQVPQQYQQVQQQYPTPQQQQMPNLPPGFIVTSDGRVLGPPRKQGTWDRVREVYNITNGLLKKVGVIKDKSAQPVPQQEE